MGRCLACANTPLFSTRHSRDAIQFLLALMVVAVSESNRLVSKIIRRRELIQYIEIAKDLKWHATAASLKRVLALSNPQVLDLMFCSLSSDKRNAAWQRRTVHVFVSTPHRSMKTKFETQVLEVVETQATSESQFCYDLEPTGLYEQDINGTFATMDNLLKWITSNLNSMWIPSLYENFCDALGALPVAQANASSRLMDCLPALIVCIGTSHRQDRGYMTRTLCQVLHDETNDVTGVLNSARLALISMRYCTANKTAFTDFIVEFMALMLERRHNAPGKLTSASSHLSGWSRLLIM